MRSASRKAAGIAAAATLALVLLLASSSDAMAQWGFFYNPQNNTAGWKLGAYQTQYQWGPGWFQSQGVGPGGAQGGYYKGPGGFGSSYYQGPGYTGWSQWGPNQAQGAGKLQVPWLNHGKPIQWSY